jgi:surface-anchored protein
MKQRHTLSSHLLAAGLLAASAALAMAQTRLTTEHVDIGIAFEMGAWDLHIHDETHDVEYSPPSGPDGAILEVGAAAQTLVSADPLFSFLGTPGSPVWILPAVQEPSLLFLGIGAEELEAGTFLNDRVNLSLHSLSGPGEFALFSFDSFGNPQVLMNSRDGISSGDTVIVPAGGHSDYNWAFSEPGAYTLNFEASGTLAEGSLFTASGPVAYSFEVVPEPGTLGLLGLGGLALLTLARRRLTSG